MKSSGTHRSKLLVVAALAILTIAVYWPALQNPFIDLDDKDYITLNPHIKDGMTLAGIRWAFTALYAGNWHPLTWLSHMLDVQLFGYTPWGHHLTSLLLHTGCTLLLFLLLNLATGAVSRSALAAALFAVHPLHVESVAWAAERKDVLCAFFLLIALCCYCAYAAQRSRALYLSSLAATVLALLSKPMAVSTPLLLILVDYWPLRRFGRGASAEPFGIPRCPPLPLRQLILEKAPFALLSAASCGLTYAAQSGAHAVAGSSLPLFSRIQNALLAYQGYLIKMFYPVKLAVFYPLHIPVPFVPSVAAGAVLLAVSVAVGRLGRSFPYLVTGWAWYLITLVPVIGMVQVGLQAMADRYTYIPLIGIFVLLVWGVGDATRKFHVPSTVSYGSAGIVILALSIGCFNQARLWRSDLSLFGHALAVTDENYFAAKIVGDAYQGQNDHPEAIKYFLKALSFNPPTDGYRSMIEADLADSLAATGNVNGAIAYSRSAIDHDPSNAQALSQLGRQLEKVGKLGEAAEYYGRALSLVPDDADVHYRLGRILEQQGDRGGALGHFLTTVRLQPGYAEAHNSAGVVYALQGDCTAAMVHFTKALQARPGYVDAERNLDECREIVRREH